MLNIIFRVSVIEALSVCAVALAAVGLVIYRFRLYRKIHVLLSMSTRWLLAGTCCLLLTCIASAFGLLRPHHQTKSELPARAQVALLVALDVSRSMMVEDCMPTRLACAKKRIADLVDAVMPDQVGLILFADTAWVYCPLTNDRAAFDLFLASVDLRCVSSGGTDVMQAISCAQAAYQQEAYFHKVVVMVSDGQDVQVLAHAPAVTAKELSLAYMCVATPEGGPVPCYASDGTKTGYEQQADGTYAIVGYAEKELAELTKTGMVLRVHEPLTPLVTWIKKQEETAPVVDAQVCYEYYPWAAFAAGLSFIIQGCLL